MKASPTIDATRVIAQSRLFQIEEVDLTFSNGEIRCFERIRGKRTLGAVMIVPLLDHETFLLVREYAVGLERYELAFPKGLREEGEDLYAAASRELMEEVGYHPAKLTDLGILSVAPGYMTGRMPILLATDLTPARAQGDEPEPIVVVPWLLREIPSLLARDDFSEARSVAALLLLKEYLKQ